MNQVRIKELSKEHLEKEIITKGWVDRVRKLGDLVFIVIADISGSLQIVVDKNNEFYEEALSLKNQYLVEVTGLLRIRKDINPDIKNGDLELALTNLNLLSKAKQPPFVLSDDASVLEQQRMKYRYLDFRRPKVRNNLIVRSKLYQIFRNELLSKDFIEVETPYITLPTLGGSKELEIYPSQFENKFYTLTQSPQVYKQLLMVGGFDRYFQIAKCFRDEKSRSDRQIEFTQLDLEMSFTNEDEVKELIEKMMQRTFAELMDYQINAPFRRMSYFDAMLTYGSDKPDLRIETKIKNYSKFFENKIAFIDEELKNGKDVFGIRFKIDLTKSKIKKISNEFKKQGIILFGVGKTTEETFTTLNGIDQTSFDLQTGEVIIFAIEKKYPEQLGNLRLSIAKEFDLIQDDFKFLWVESFPMFEIEDGKIASSHNPFTQPLDEQFFNETEIDKLANYPSRSYDLVLNGLEIAGGSIRINNPKQQRAIFELMGYSTEDIEQYFGYFIEALSYGTPIHGGIAIGIDRLLAIMLNEESIRDVIAFPKTSHATDEMTGGPFSKNVEK